MASYAIPSTPYSMFALRSDLESKTGGAWYCDRNTPSTSCFVLTRQQMRFASGFYMAIAGNLEARIILDIDLSTVTGNLTYAWGYQACRTDLSSDRNISSLVGQDSYNDLVPQCSSGGVAALKEIRHTSTLTINLDGTIPLAISSAWIGDGMENATAYIGAFYLRIPATPAMSGIAPTSGPMEPVVLQSITVSEGATTSSPPGAFPNAAQGTAGGGLDTDAITGIAVASVLFCVALVLSFLWWKLRREERGRRSGATPPPRGEVSFLAEGSINCNYGVPSISSIQKPLSPTTSATTMSPSQC